MEVGARTHVETVNPSPRHQFDKVVVAMLILGQHHQVPAALVHTLLFQPLVAAARHVHFTTEDRFEVGNALLLDKRLLCLGNQLLRTLARIGVVAVLVGSRSISPIP